MSIPSAKPYWILSQKFGIESAILANSAELGALFPTARFAGLAIAGFALNLVAVKSLESGLRK